MSELLLSAELWVLVGFVILVGGLFKKIYSAVTGGLDARAVRIKAQLDEAEKLREDAQSLLAEYQRKQRAAAEDARGIVAQAQAEAQRLREQAQADLEHALKRREQQALDKIAQAEAEALAEVRGKAVDVAVAAAGRLIADNLDAAKSNEVMSRSIDEVKAKLN